MYQAFHLYPNVPIVVYMTSKEMGIDLFWPCIIDIDPQSVKVFPDCWISHLLFEGVKSDAGVGALQYPREELWWTKRTFSWKRATKV